MNTKNENKKDLLKNSIDYTICKRGIIIYGMIVLFIFVAFLLVALLTKKMHFLLVALPSLAFYIPFVCYNIKRMLSITKEVEWIFCETILSEPQTSFNATIYFKVKIQESDNVPVELTTNSIGATRGIVRPHLSQLNNKKVLIAWNKITDDIVVLKCI